jgi:hypothetical protein
MMDIVLFNLVSPAVLFFVLGFTASFFKSDLKFPQALSESLSIYLLIAIGLKGGIELSRYSLGTLFAPIVGTLILGIVIPIVMFLVCTALKIDRKNAIALAATYGSVSIVTFGAAIAFLEETNIEFESYLSAMVVLLESPAIFISLMLLGWLESRNKSNKIEQTRNYKLGIMPQPENSSAIKWIDPHLIKESLVNKSILLMLGALLVGMITGDRAIPAVKTVFIDLYSGILVIFLLGMGLLAGERIAEMKKYGLKMIGLAIVMPLLFGIFGVLIGYSCGLSEGGTALMGILGASSSYIAAPAAIRQSIPEANPSIYLGMSLGVTFPFNLIVGMPIYLLFAQWIHSL